MHSLEKEFSGTFLGPGTVLGAGDRALSKMDLILRTDLILSLWSLETDY